MPAPLWKRTKSQAPLDRISRQAGLPGDRSAAISLFLQSHDLLIPGLTTGTSSLGRQRSLGAGQRLFRRSFLVERGVSGPIEREAEGHMLARQVVFERPRHILHEVEAIGDLPSLGRSEPRALRMYAFTQ